ncbi:hypothetical protein VTN96DRAFT_1757 [Rasamsonia emersonii]
MFLLKNLDLHRSKKKNRPTEQSTYRYPPNLSSQHAESLLAQIKDWQLNHGSLLKLVQSETEHSVLARPIGVSVFPTLFPRPVFQHALDLESTYNELYCAVAEDEEWLWDVTKDLVHVEPLAAALWHVHHEVKKAGSVQPLSAGIFRSDYMLHVQSRDDNHDDDDDESNPLANVTLKQVEFNSYSCAGGSHANKVVDMHRYLVRTGAYNHNSNDEEEEEREEEKEDTNPIQPSAIPPNYTIHSLASCLATAHAAYGAPKSQIATKTAVLFIVQPRNFNIADERPIEYALWNRDPPVPAYRVDFPLDVLAYTSLSESGRELLFHPPWLRGKNPLEISVVYMRAGYEAEEYETDFTNKVKEKVKAKANDSSSSSSSSSNSPGRQARLRLELSRAIKCPSLLAHIATFKKVQQALAVPGTLERWLPPDKAAKVRETFMPLYPLDDASDAGRTGRQLATNRPSARSHVLKPSSLEGGSHNVYGEAIPGFLASIPQAQWSSYILMERIRSPSLYNVLMSPPPREIFAGRVVSELGVFGTCLWKRRTSQSRSNNHCDLLVNAVGGWSFKTKDAQIDEMSVVKGYGCFDTPCLVDV